MSRAVTSKVNSFFLFMEEVFKDIPGYEGIYQVSNLGNVKSLKWNRERILKQCKDNGGYFQVILSKNNKIKNIRVHQLVAITFLGHITCGHKLVVDHINDVKTDNRMKNLQIITTRENSFKTQGKYSSKYKGVSWCKRSKKWMSYIYMNKKLINLGYYINELEASNTYQNKLKTLTL